MSDVITVLVQGKVGSGKTQVVSVIREAFLAMGITVEVIDPEGDCPDARDSAISLKKRGAKIFIEEKQVRSDF